VLRSHQEHLGSLQGQRVLVVPVILAGQLCSIPGFPVALLTLVVPRDLQGLAVLEVRLSA